jgi:hypothetical protein
MKKLILSFVFIAACASSVMATLSENAKIYLLTCQPGTEVYSTFGHSAFYVEDEENGIDYVFNYGVFSFETENFLYKFVKGETYYMLDVENYDHFLKSYARRKMGVYAQKLSLTNDEKEQLFDALMTNALPENRVYRYDFFYDNCATRLRDMLENNIVGEEVFFPDSRKPQTFRDLIELYTGQNTWLKFGIDILVGAPADKIATEYEKMFLPDILKDDFSETLIQRNFIRTPLVSSNAGQQIIPDFPREKSSGIFSPIVVMWAVFAIALIISLYGFIRKKACCWFDFILFFATGLIGVLVFYISFISIHPAVFPNYNILWLHPLQLVFAFCLLSKTCRSYAVYYHFFNLAMLIAAFAMSLFAQTFHPAFYPLRFTLVLRSLFGICYHRIAKK